MKKNKGSLTVEACLSLTVFLMVFMTILYVLRIVFAYEIVQHSLNQAAKEFSTYSYYYAVSGLGDVNGQIISSTSGGRDSFNENVGNIVSVYNEFNDMGDAARETYDLTKNADISGAMDSLPNIKTEYSEFQDSLGPATDTIKSVASDPVAALKSVGSVMLSGGNEIAKTFVCGEIARALMTKYIADGYDAADKRLKELRIVGGLKGLNFGMSEFWSPGGQNDIVLTVCYTIDPVFPIKVIKDLNVVNTVRVRGWSAESIF